MKKSKQQVSSSRRKFLVNASVGGGAAVAASLPGASVAAVEPAQEGAKPREGYRLTQHILDYYKGAAS